MRELDEQLQALEALEDIPDEDEQDRARDVINARIRTALRSNPGARTYLENIPICDSEQAFVAMSMIEALAVGEPDDDDVRMLEWYFDVAAKKAESCPDQPYVLQVLTSYVHLEDGSGVHKFDLLPRYLALTRSRVAPLRRTAVDLLLGFEVASAPGVRDALLRLLSDRDSSVRRAAEELLREENALPMSYRPG
jgi:hypothetical protein